MCAWLREEREFTYCGNLAPLSRLIYEFHLMCTFLGAATKIEPLFVSFPFQMPLSRRVLNFPYAKIRVYSA